MFKKYILRREASKKLQMPKAPAEARQAPAEARRARAYATSQPIPQTPEEMAEARIVEWKQQASREPGGHIAPLNLVGLGLKSFP